MTAPRWETTNEDARFCVRCGELGDVDAAGLCKDCPAFYEPWQPKVGDRVRVRLSGECQAVCIYYRRAGAPLHKNIPDGRIGTVVEGHPMIDANDARLHARDGHTYPVEFDDAVLAPYGFIVGSHFAATELEPLDDDRERRMLPFLRVVEEPIEPTTAD